MLLIDYGAISHVSVFSMPEQLLSKQSIMNVIFRDIFKYIEKYKSYTGDKNDKVFICVDSGSWRKDIHPEYKAGRKENKRDSTIDWNVCYEAFNECLNSFKTIFNLNVVKCQKAEADDIIAILALESASKEIMIISADKDLANLQHMEMNPNNIGKVIKQFSPQTKKLVTVDSNEIYYHILKGDSADNIKNILSPREYYKMDNPPKQKSITKKLINDVIIEDRKGNLKNFLIENYGEDIYNNYEFNRKLIDLTCIPKDVCINIKKETLNAVKEKSYGDIMNFFFSNGMLNIMNDFKNKGIF